MKPLIFGIGLHKTGTCTLHQCFADLGYRSVHNAFVVPEFLKYDRKLGRPLLGGLVASGFNAFSDNPFPCIFKQVDQTYPNSLFIVTHRDFESWFRSRLFHPSITISWGITREKSLREYESHHQAVRDYFGERDNVLWWSICENPSWEPLCRFLGKPIPKKPFPWAYRSPRYTFDYNNLAKNIEKWAAEYRDLAVPVRKNVIHIYHENIPKAVWLLVNVCAHPESKLICHFQPSPKCENNLRLTGQIEKVIFKP